jgi:hypothetical protein
MAFEEKTTLWRARCTVSIDRQGIQGAGALGILPDAPRATARDPNDNKAAGLPNDGLWRGKLLV